MSENLLTGFQWWVSTEKARSIGCTHRARFMGLVPGFINPETNLWVARSDLLNWLSDALAFVWVFMRELRGEEPDFMFVVGPRIYGGEQ